MHINNYTTPNTKSNSFQYQEAFSHLQLFSIYFLGAVSQSASAVSSPAPTLLGQPQVAAPQYIVTTGGVGQSATMGLQQLLIPVSAGNAGQLQPQGEKPCSRQEIRLVCSCLSHDIEL